MIFAPIWKKIITELKPGGHEFVFKSTRSQKGEEHG